MSDHAPAAALPMDTAPKNNTLVRLLVDYSGENGDHPLEDAEQAWTIGFNNFEDSEIDEWQFAGWSWSQDCFCEGQGRVMGWAPYHPEQRLYDASAPMADGGEAPMTAAEEVLAWLLIEKIGVPDDVTYSPDEAQRIIVARLDDAGAEIDMAAIHLGAAVLSKIEDQAVREQAIRNALTAAARTAKGISHE